jgi:hypothetical protein
MNLKYFTLLFVLAIQNLEQPLFAQNINIKWSEAVNGRNSFEDAILLSNGNTIFLQFYQRDGGIDLPVFDSYLFLLDKQWNTISKTKLEIPQFNSLSKIKLLKSKGKAYLIDNYSRQSDNRIITMAYEIDTNNATIGNGKIIDDFELPFNPNKAFTTVINQEFTLIRFSPDSSKFLILTYWPVKQEGNAKYHVSVFNLAAEKKWSRAIELPLETKRAAIKDIYFSNNEEVFISIGYLQEKFKLGLLGRSETEFPPATLKFYQFSATNETEINFDLKDKYAHDIGLIQKNDQLQIIGLYKQQAASNIKGLFISSISQDLKTVEQPFFIEIDDNKIENLGNDNFAKGDSNAKGLKLNFKLHTVNVRNNGSIDLLCKYFETTPALKLVDFPKKGSFIYGDLLNINLKQDNSIALTRIPKKALGLEDRWILNSYPISSNNKLMVIYNDGDDNLDEEETQKVKRKNRYSESSLVAAIVDENGNLTRQVLHKNGIVDFFPSLNLVPLAPNKFLLNAYNLSPLKPRAKFGILEIESN